MLARIIQTRPGEPSRGIKNVLGYLLGRADYEDRRTKPIDWSFRTGPQDYRNPSAGTP